MSKKILIMSDSHGFDNLIDKVLSKEKYDIAIFAGDYTTDLSYMKERFDYFVDGNNDCGYKDVQIFDIENIRFVLIHSHTLFSFDKGTYFSRMRDFGRRYDADIVVYGHTHYEHIDSEHTPILVNPGSIALPRSPKHKGSYILATANNGKVEFKIKYI